MARKPPAKPLVDQLVDRLTRLQSNPAGYSLDAESFIKWAERHCYNLDRDKTWRPWRFLAWQKEEMRKVMERSGRSWRFLTWMLCWPRRHSKTQHAAFIALFFACEFSWMKIVCTANSEDQVVDTTFTKIVETIENSPPLKARKDAGEIIVYTTEIVFSNGSKILAIPSSERSAYGKGVDLAIVSELCRARDDSLYQVLASSTGDKGGVVLVDSNVGDETNIVWGLIELAQSGQDPSIAASYIWYEDIADCVHRGLAPWIDEAWLRSRQAQMKLGEFIRNHFNKPAFSTGGRMKLEWLSHFYDEIPADGDWRSDWDIEGGTDDVTNKTSSDSAGIVSVRPWGSPNIYIIEVVCGRFAGGQFDLGRLPDVALDVAKRWPKIRRHRFEYKAFGRGLVKNLRTRMSGVEAINPVGSKMERFEESLPTWMTGNVLLPRWSVDWKGKFVAHMLAYNGKGRTDIGDASSQMVTGYSVLAADDGKPKYQSLLKRAAAGLKGRLW